MKAFLAGVLPSIREMLEAFKHEVADLVIERIQKMAVFIPATSQYSGKKTLQVERPSVKIDESLADVGVGATGLERGDRRMAPLGEREAKEDKGLGSAAEKLKNLKRK